MMSSVSENYNISSLRYLLEIFMHRVSVDVLLV